jgi:hypothetical protein
MLFCETLFLFNFIFTCIFTHIEYFSLTKVLHTSPFNSINDKTPNEINCVYVVIFTFIFHDTLLKENDEFSSPTELPAFFVSDQPEKALDY